ncbi:MAG: hypothetical protein K2K81_06395 [Muribaculaceae bacterium]|nr:hypothetical protein [Muribaculaceae bacterium]
MTKSTTRSRKIPARSKMSDEELEQLLKQAQEQHPEQFARKTSGGNVTQREYNRIASVTEVISKWL